MDMQRAAFSTLRRRAGCAAGLLVAVLLGWPGAARADSVSEATAKVQFIHYVAQYAVWPKDALPPQHKQFILGVLGGSPFGDALERYFKGKSVKGREIVIRYFNTVEEAKGCHILFINAAMKTSFAEVLEKLQDFPTLTISDSEAFVQKNGMIYMFIIPKSEITGGLAWDINSAALKKARLQIDPFFIEKARKVYN